MKNSFLLLIIFFCAQVQGQESYKPKIDTLYFSGNYNYLEESRITKIVYNFPKICGDEYFTPNDDPFSKIEFFTVNMIKSFNREANTTIFTQADAVIVAYFCRDSDYSIGNALYEFTFPHDKISILAFEKLENLYKKTSFDTPIGIKNWYYKRSKNKLYLITSRIPDEYNSVKIELQKRIELQL